MVVCYNIRTIKMGTEKQICINRHLSLDDTAELTIVISLCFDKLSMSSHNTLENCKRFESIAVIVSCGYTYGI